MQFGWGYKPDLGDFRDIPYELSGQPLPSSADLLRPKLPPAYDQLSLGSCTANALCGAMQAIHDGFNGSRLWLYYKERAIEHTIREDSGAEIRDGIKVLVKHGLPPESDYPYDIGKFTHTPPPSVTAEAKTDIVTKYMRLDTDLDQIKDCLAQGFGVVAGITCYEGLESRGAAETGHVPMPKGNPIGGHAILLVGYGEGQIMFRNSWGPDWGDDGYGYLPEAYVGNANLTTDLWTVRA